MVIINTQRFSRHLHTRRLKKAVFKMANRAAWQIEKQGPITVGSADMHEPGKGEVRIKVRAAAIQPADGKQALHAVVPRFEYPGILGSTCSGTVDALGGGVTRVRVGDRVAAGLGNYANGGDPSRASHQRFTIAEEFEVVNIGPTLSFADAVASNTQTPAASLFKFLGMDYPTVDPPAKPEPKNQKILIWGGSSAMGALSIGYAKQAGYEVITTASEHNFELLKSLGADHVFDRSAEDVVDQISGLLPIRFWFDTVCTPDSVPKVVDLAMLQRKREDKEIHLLMLLPPIRGVRQ